MICNNIGDIKIRPLRIKEMLLIKGFPGNYLLIGTQAEQKKHIGNAVPCKQVETIVGHSIDINRPKMAA